MSTPDLDRVIDHLADAFVEHLPPEAIDHLADGMVEYLLPHALVEDLPPEKIDELSDAIAEHLCPDDLAESIAQAVVKRVLGDGQIIILCKQLLAMLRSDTA
jgi:hypothetical protein